MAVTGELLPLQGAGFTDTENPEIDEAMRADGSVDVPPPFQWGGYVRVRSGAAQHYPISEGSVCGVRRVGDGATAAAFGAKIGSLLLLVEGADGRAIEIPIEQLEAD